jgi:hypothetical protein
MVGQPRGHAAQQPDRCAGQRWLVQESRVVRIGRGIQERTLIPNAERSVRGIAPPTRLPIRRGQPGPKGIAVALMPRSGREEGRRCGPDRRYASDHRPTHHLRLKASGSAARGTIEADKWRAAWNNLDDRVVMNQSYRTMDNRWNTTGRSRSSSGT